MPAYAPALRNTLWYTLVQGTQQRASPWLRRKARPFPTVPAL